jgi:hypothetical protein
MKLEKGMIVKVKGQQGNVYVTGERNGGGEKADFVGITEDGQEMMFTYWNLLVDEIQPIQHPEMKAELTGLLMNINNQLVMLARDEHARTGRTRQADEATKALNEIAIRLQLV